MQHLHFALGAVALHPLNAGVGGLAPVLAFCGGAQVQDVRLQLMQLAGQPAASVAVGHLELAPHRRMPTPAPAHRHQHSMGAMPQRPTRSGGAARSGPGVAQRRPELRATRHHGHGARHAAFRPAHPSGFWPKTARMCGAKCSMSGTMTMMSRGSKLGSSLSHART